MESFNNIINRRITLCLHPYSYIYTNKDKRYNNKITINSRSMIQIAVYSCAFNTYDHIKSLHYSTLRFESLRVK